MLTLRKLAFLLLATAPLFAQSAPATTTVADQLFMAVGPTYCTGSITISWNDFYSQDGYLIKAGTLSTPVNSMGQFSVLVVPTNINTTPASGIYSIRYNLQPAGCAATSEAWNVPSSGSPVDLNMVRALPSPPPSLIPITSLYPSLLSGTYTLCSINFIIQWGNCGGGGGSGTVTNFSAGSLSPLFGTSVATSTTTPALSFSLTNAAGTTFFGNPTGSSAAPVYMSATQATAALNPFTSLLQGLAPASGGGSVNFLRADGTWAVPAGSGSGTVTSVSSGNLSPLFTVNVATPTSTPAFTFSLTNAAGISWFGNAGGSSGAPSYNTTAFPNALIPAPTLSALGGAEAINAVTHQWLNSLSTAGVFGQSQPACADLSTAAGGCSMSTTAGGDLSGTLPSPTVVKINGGAMPASAPAIASNSSSQPIAATTSGSGSTVVLQTSPTITTPIIATRYGGSSAGSTATLNGTSNGSPSGAAVFVQTNGQNTEVGNSATPDSLLTVSQNTAATAAARSGIAHFVGPNSGAGIVSVDGYAGPSDLLQRRGDGTAASPTAVQSGETIGSHLHQGYNGSAFATGAAIQSFATQNWTTSAQGTQVQIETTPNGSTAPQTALTLQQDGQLVAPLLQSAAGNAPACYSTSTGLLTYDASGCGGSSGGGSKINFVQGAATLASGGQTTTAQAFAVNVVSGDLLCVAAGWQGTTAANPTAADTLSTTLSFAGGINGHSENVGILCGVASSSGADTITVTWPSASSYVFVAIAEFNGVKDTVDVQAGAYAPSPFNSVSATTTVAGDLLLMANSASSGSTTSACIGSTWAAPSQNNGAIGGELCWAIQNSAGLFTNGAYYPSGNQAIEIVALEHN
jgi:hypothetical protein